MEQHAGRRAIRVWPGNANCTVPKCWRHRCGACCLDPKSVALVDNFAGQWLELRNLDSVKPDPDRFPNFDDDLRKAMKQETRLFFEAVIHEDRSILDFIDGKFTFLNERLAKHYGIPGITGPQFRRVELTGDQRSGVLTQASVLTVSSYPTRTSPCAARQMGAGKFPERSAAALHRRTSRI